MPSQTVRSLWDVSWLQECSGHSRELARPSVQKLLALENSVQGEFAKAA
jgi:hypothetical protein